MKRILSTLFLLHLLAISLHGQSKFTISEATEPQNIYTSLSVFKNSTSDWTAQDFLTLEPAQVAVYKVSESDTVKGKDATFWAVFELENPFDREYDGILEVGGMDEAFLHSVLPNGEISIKKSGRLIPASQRDLPEGTPKEVRFTINVPASSTGKFLLQLKNPTGNPIYFNNASIQRLDSWKDIFYQKEKSKTMMISLIVGFAGIMFLYNLFIFFLSGDKVYLLYSLYIFFPMFYIMAILGALNLTFVGENPIVYLYFRVLPPILTMLFYLYFIRVFLNTSKNYPKWDRAFRWLIWAEWFCLVLGLVTVPTLNELLFRMGPIIIHALVQIASLLLLFRLVFKKDKSRMAVYFAVGSAFFFGGALFYMSIIILKWQSVQFGLTVQALGIAGEIITYSLGLGYRIRLIEREKRDIQEKHASLLEEQNNTLETKVKERTWEIEQQKEEILTQNEELQQQHEEIVTQRDYIANQNNELSEKNKHITDSIRYAQTIQEAILPFKERLDTVFNHDYFVLFKPKDIVSGDFYWFEQVGNKKFLAVVDCTGHGVPGAFMSMVGFSVLNDEVIKSNIHDPAHILDRMHNTITRILKQDEAEGNQDGMDVAFCTIEDKSNNMVELNFCGAKRPLYFFAPYSDELQELKGDRRSIGGYQGKGKNFHTQKVILPKGSKVYICTDGLADQHNTKGRKFGSLRLKKLLSRIYKLPMDGQQKTLEEVLELHQKGQHQRDDITLLGFKV